MGCLIKSMGLFILFAILLPVILLITLFGRIKIFSSKQNTTSNEDENTFYRETQENDEQQDNSNKPIDSSTIEYIDFEEVKDNENNIGQ